MVRCTGQETAAESRVAVDRENESIGPEDVERAIGPEMVVELRQKTGLSRCKILSRLAATLPQTVNRLTLHGRLPSEDEARDLVRLPSCGSGSAGGKARPGLGSPRCPPLAGC